MTEQTPEYLSDIEILDILQSLKKDKLDAEANKIIRNGGKAGRQEAHKQALVALNTSFEDFHFKNEWKYQFFFIVAV
mgnify:CR=1 FL=1